MKFFGLVVALVSLSLLLSIKAAPTMPVEDDDAQVISVPLLKAASEFVWSPSEILNERRQERDAAAEGQEEKGDDKDTPAKKLLAAVSAILSPLKSLYDSAAELVSKLSAGEQPEEKRLERDIQDQDQEKDDQEKEKRPERDVQDQEKDDDQEKEKRPERDVQDQEKGEEEDKEKRPERDVQDQEKGEEEDKEKRPERAAQEAFQKCAKGAKCGTNKCEQGSGKNCGQITFN